MCISVLRIMNKQQNIKSKDSLTRKENSPSKINQAAAMSKSTLLVKLVIMS